MSATMRPYAGPPPPRRSAAAAWGSEDHLRGLLGDRVTDVSARKQTVRVDRSPTPEAFHDYFKANYGPTIAAYRALVDQPDRVAALNHDLAALAERFDEGPAPVRRCWTGSTSCLPPASAADE